MTHVMPKLPYAADALAPVMSKETIDYHCSVPVGYGLLSTNMASYR